MQSDVFYWVLNMSIIGSLVGLIVFILSKTKRLPRFAIYLLWLLPLVRLLSPFGIANQYSLLNLISKFTTKTVIIWQQVPNLSATNFFQAAKSYFPIEYKTDLLKGVFEVAALVWIIIASALIMTSIMLYIITKSELKSAKHIRDNIYKSDKISAPAVYGIITPKIIIPMELADKEITNILKHETVHIKRKDNIWHIVAIFTACVHWFNPFVWLFLKSFFSDMELACDTKVLKTLTSDEKKSYAMSILNAGLNKTFFASAFGGAKIKLRMANILYYKKLTFISALCSSVLIIAIAIILITNAVQ